MSNQEQDKKKDPTPRKTVEIERNEVIDILTIIKGFERKLQDKLKQA